MSKTKITDAGIIFSNRHIEMGLASELPGIGAGRIVRMKIGKDEKLHIRDTANHAEVTINFSQTKHTEIVFEKQSVMSNKNMLGRAVFGGVLFGDVGAVVGAMTGMGEKSKKKIVAVFALDYTDKNGNIQRILFVETEKTSGLFAFQKKLCKAAGMHFSVQPKAQPVEL